MNIRRSISRLACMAALAVCAASVPACRIGGSSSVEKANDDLRLKVTELERRAEVLEGEKKELSAKLEESERSQRGELAREVLDAIPRCVSVSVGSLSGYQPGRGAGEPGKIVVDINPEDAYGRFVQIVGTLTVEARALARVGGNAADERVFGAELGPAQVREAYRAGLLGPRYTVEIPAPNIPAPGDLVMRVKFADALSGRVLDAQLTRPVREASGVAAR